MTLIILLFAIGILLLAAEIIIPGGVLGILGAALLFTGSVVSFIQLGTTEGLIAIALALLVTATVLYIQLKLLPKTPLGKRFFLQRQITATATAAGKETQDLIGKTATSVTLLSPSGYVTIEGKRYEALSQSGQIPPGTPLIVKAANSFQIIVATKP